MRKLEIVLWVVSVTVPVIVMVIGFILVTNRKQKRDPSSEQPTSLPLISNNTQCGTNPIPCDPSDSRSCATCDEGFVCTNVESNDTDHDIEGTFCLPQKPSSACSQLPTDTNARMQGTSRWTGWGGINVQQWDCACPYPQYYPMDTTAQGLSSGACKRSSALCRNGVWKYPCKRPEVNGVVSVNECEVLSDEESAKLVGSDPLQNGLCSCDNVPCVDGADCAGNCVDGVCVGQRLSMNSTSGLPECVPDTCEATISCTDSCPGGASCVGGKCEPSTSTCNTDVDCGEGGVCNGGKCLWGVWETSPTPPYVFGNCVCPATCNSKGSVCICE